MVNAARFDASESTIPAISRGWPARAKGMACIDPARRSGDISVSAAGVNTGIICAPVLPGITDNPAALDALVSATKQAGGRYIYANALFLKPCSASVFLPFLEKEFPHLTENYRKRFAGRAFVSKAYSKRLSELLRSLRRKHGISKQFGSRGEVTYPQPVEEQLKLFA